MRCLTLLILIMRGLMDLFRRARPVWAGASAPPGTGPASARAPKLRCAPPRLASRPVGQGARRSRASGLPAGTPGSRPDGGSLPNAAHRRTRQRRQSAPVHANAFETPPCAPGADPLPPQRPARRPSADRTMHSNEKRLLSNSKSLRSPTLSLPAARPSAWCAARRTFIPARLSARCARIAADECASGGVRCKITALWATIGGWMPGFG
jgi:hypothetical protein